MKKTVIFSALIALGFQGNHSDMDGHEPFLRLKEEAMVLEYTASAGEATIIIAGETEERLERVHMRDPHGGVVLSVAARKAPGLTLQGFVLEMGESDAATLMQAYPEGTYSFTGRSVAGQHVMGSASLSHDLLPAPNILFPKPGTLGISSRDLVISWVPDSEAVGYRVGVEQGDSDTLNADLPGTASSFRVPAGLLAPYVRTQVEVGAVAPNGNITVVEVVFSTM